MPVLSEQITVVQPSVSTLGSVLHTKGTSRRHVIACGPSPSPHPTAEEQSQQVGVQEGARAYVCSCACQPAKAPAHRTIAFCLAILRVPSARQVVTTAGRPSGIAATARARVSGFRV